MALRNRRSPVITDWLGLQTQASERNLKPGWWTDSSNIIVTQDGSAACIRSPKNWNDTVSDPIISAFNFDTAAASAIFFDTTGGNTYSTVGTTNTAVTSATGGSKAKWLTIGKRAYRLQGGHGVFTTHDLTPTLYFNGIAKPAAAPTISYVAGGSGSYVVSVNASYAYYNTTTGHVSRPSDASNTLGPTAGNHKIRIPTVASVVTGVDKIVFFLTLDGGSIRYLLIDGSGDPITVNNATANNDIDIITILGLLDTGTYEPTSNYTIESIVVSDTPYFMFTYKTRLCLIDFRSDDRRASFMYNASETVPIGVPTESWPPQNSIYAPNKSDWLRGGIETPLGALVLGEYDSYMLRGDLTDKISSPQNVAAITESFQALGWSIGTRSAFTVKVTPFGVVWLDQNKRLQMWDYSNFPIEIGLPMRNSLDDIDDDLTARFNADAEWFQHGKDGGIYVLTAEVNDVQKGFAIAIFRDPEDGQLHFACAKLDTGAYSFVVGNISGRRRLFQGGAVRLQELMDLDLEGSGWSTQDRYFETVIGNDSEFTYFHSLRFDATDVTGLTVTCEDLDGDNTQDLLFIQETGSGGSYFAVINDYGFRKLIRFTFSTDDTEKRIINNLRVNTVPKKRLI